MDDRVNIKTAVREACKRMHTQPSVLAKAVRWFAKTLNPHTTDAYGSDPDLWLTTFLKLDHRLQLELLEDARERTLKTRALERKAFKPVWMR